MAHAWYSTKHAAAYPPAVFETKNGPKAATLTSDTYQKGERYIQEKLYNFDDYCYIGEVGRLLSEDPMEEEWLEDLALLESEE